MSMRNLNKQSQSLYALLAGVVAVEVTRGLTIDLHRGGRIQISRLMKDVFLMQSKFLSDVLILGLSDLELKLTYVGSAENDTYDQVLESLLVRPINVGNYRFVFEVTSK
ncbi:hypothetical protein CTI12_AA269840 [Artemisia annua]|uniref:Uncharacterized protein n=1 Tax=Artemisia annua TaxID=35608 RepID=A0A2U1LWN3_ARTAN|nr:hypothetical protein CTI12_AA269840 [Artemisia annua]